MSSYLDSPMYQQMLSRTMQGGPQSQYPGQAIANGLAQVLQAYSLKKYGEKEEAKQQSGNAEMAKALMPEDFTATPAAQPQMQTFPGSKQPQFGGGINGDGSMSMSPMQLDVSMPTITDQNADRRAQLASLLNSGAVSQDQLAPTVLDRMGFGKPKDPIKGSPGDVFFDGSTHKPIDGMSVAAKPDKPEATPDIIQIAQSLFPNDPKGQHDYMIKNSPANLRSITNYNAPKQNWQILTDPKSNLQYRYDLDSGKALTLDGQPYTPQGAGRINGGATARSPAALAAQRYVEENPNASAQDVAQFAADYGKTVKSVGAFSTGKQGDLLRSFNVAISHLNTLDGLVGALGNGDIQAFNKMGNAYAQQTGRAAPTNFDAAKAIVGDEIIKAIVGGGGALADRENAQNQVSRANSPQQLRGVINTYKELMGGQLKGLKKQYSDTTGRSDFDSRLTPEAKSELEGRQQAQQPKPTVSNW